MSKAQNGKEVTAQKGVREGEIIVSLPNEIPEMITDAKMILHLGDKTQERIEDRVIIPL